jgi:hypothetical protein
VLGKGCGSERRPDEDNEELRDWLSSQNIIRVMKITRMGWGGGLAACVWKKRNAYRVLVGKPEGREHLKNYTLRWGILLKLILIG